ncbi:hypothetical protein JQ543_13700 [Bradyrhizobium diazoefficiens]|nr:hypothetical protein [Bradyrhizobium diazoefficiens]MBR0848802.1 hypothetical protein [Bradyrhizobium diazoefficiens]
MLLDPPDEATVAAIAEHLIRNGEPVETIAGALGLPARELLDRYAPSAVN